MHQKFVRTIYLEKRIAARKPRLPTLQGQRGPDSSDQQHK